MTSNRKVSGRSPARTGMAGVMAMKGLSRNTRETCPASVCRPAGHWGRAPQALSADGIRSWVTGLIGRRLSPRATNAGTSALRLFPADAMGEPGKVEGLRCRRVPDSLPRSIPEVAALQVADVRGDGGPLRIRGGKGGHGRMAHLPGPVPGATGRCWRGTRPRPSSWLFRRQGPNRPITAASLRTAFSARRDRAGPGRGSLSTACATRSPPICMSAGRGRPAASRTGAPAAATCMPSGSPAATATARPAGNAAARGRMDPDAAFGETVGNECRRARADGPAGRRHPAGAMLPCRLHAAPPCRPDRAPEPRNGPRHPLPDRRRDAARHRRRNRGRDPERQARLPEVRRPFRTPAHPHETARRGSGRPPGHDPAARASARPAPPRRRDMTGTPAGKGRRPRHRDRDAPFAPAAPDGVTPRRGDASGRPDPVPGRGPPAVDTSSRTASGYRTDGQDSLSTVGRPRPGRASFKPAWCRRVRRH